MVNYLAILPEILLLFLAFILMLVDLSLKEKGKDTLNWLALVGLGITFVLTIVYAQPGGEEVIWGGMLRHDWMAFVFQLVFIVGAAFTVVFSRGWEAIGERGEFYTLLVLSTLGMTLMAAAGDLVMLLLAIETASIPLYIMAGFSTTDDKSSEAGFKYLLFGAMTSAVMMYGFSLLFGFSGTTNIYEIAEAITANGVPTLPLMASIVLVLVGFGFKVSMFPFHFWSPDVYEGAPTPVTGFLSTASKAAGFAVMARVMLVAFPMVTMEWQTLLAILSAITMTFGNLVALRQTNIKRMLAYSSIGHAGYILMGVAAASYLGVISVVYYIAAYLLTNLAAFGFVAVYYKFSGSDQIEDYAGFSRRSPGLAFAMLFTFLSLGGIPPLGGFFGKVLVFSAAVEAGMVWLAVIGVINAVIALYYYLTVLKFVYLRRQEGDEEPFPVSKTQSVSLAILVLGVAFLGIVMAPMYDLAMKAASSFF